MLYCNIDIFVSFYQILLLWREAVKVTVVVVSCCLARAGAGAALIMYSVARRPSQLVQKSRNRAGERKFS